MQINNANYNIEVNESINKISLQLEGISQSVEQQFSNEVSFSEERLLKIRSILDNFKQVYFLIEELEQKSVAKIILSGLFQLEHFCEKSAMLTQEVVKRISIINSFIHCTFRDPIVFYDLDNKCFSLMPMYIKFFSSTRTLMAHNALSKVACSIALEENPIIFECLPKLAFGHMFMLCFKENGQQSAKGWLSILQQEGMNLLQDRIDQLKHKSYPEMIAERETICNHIMPKFHNLFIDFHRVVDNISKIEPEEDVRECFYRKLSQGSLNKQEEVQIEIYAELFELIQSICSIISLYNREMFNSTMKIVLSLSQKELLKILDQES